MGRGVRLLCVDGTSKRHNLEHLLPARPPRPGTPVRIEQTCRQHGTVARLAGLDVRNRQVTGLVRRRRHQEFLDILEALLRR